MAVVQSPPALLLFLAAALLSVCGAGAERGRALPFLGGLCWAAGTVCALVEGAPLDELLLVTLALLLISAAGGKRKAADL